MEVHSLGSSTFRGRRIRRIAVLLGSVATAIAAAAYMRSAHGQENTAASPVFLSEMPSGYRDWRFISVAHEEGNLHSFAAVLGNDQAIAAYREQKPWFPDGTIIAALHYSHVPSDENNAVFGRPQSFVPGSPTNIQFMVKDSTKYASTGGWGFGHFNTDGKPGTEVQLQSCFPCHAKASHDFVFTHYAP